MITADGVRRRWSPVHLSASPIKKYISKTILLQDNNQIESFLPEVSMNSLQIDFYDNSMVNFFN